MKKSAVKNPSIKVMKSKLLILAAEYYWPSEPVSVSTRRGDCGYGWNISVVMRDGTYAGNFHIAKTETAALVMGLVEMKRG